MGNWLIGVDTGGTFTDLIAFDQASGALQRAKVPSVPSDPSLAVVDAFKKIFPAGVSPADVAAWNLVFQQGALEGIGFDYASGDGGSNGPEGGLPTSARAISCARAHVRLVT